LNINRRVTKSKNRTQESEDIENEKKIIIKQRCRDNKSKEELKK